MRVTAILMPAGIEAFQTITSSADRIHSIIFLKMQSYPISRPASIGRFLTNPPEAPYSAPTTLR
jgi:hypothetical protein